MTVGVLGGNITLREDSAPYIHRSHVANKGLVCMEASSKFVLVLSDNGGTSGTDRAAGIEACTTVYDHTIFVPLIVSVSVAPCEADMVPFPMVTEPDISIPFKKKKRNWRNDNPIINSKKLNGKFHRKVILIVHVTVLLANLQLFTNFFSLIHYFIR